MGCDKKPIENPHLIDPIYLDIVEREKGSTTRIGQLKIDIERLKGDVRKANPQGKQRTTLRGYLAKANKELLQVQQKQLFYRLMAEKRMKQALSDYREAFSKKESWPPKQDYENYKVFHKLQSAPRDWNYRVPKPKRMMANKRMRQNEARKKHQKKKDAKKVKK